jgi:hypothetical protein
MKRLSYFILFSLFFATTFAQDNQNTAQAIEAKQYIFRARTALPQTGGARQLTSSYDVTVRNDTVIAYLPYFGRAYSAAIGRTPSGIDFTSTKFTYNIKEGKKGGWSILIEPKDVEDVRQLTLNLSENGYGTLMVTSQNRQPISFTGVAEPLKEKK